MKHCLIMNKSNLCLWRDRFDVGNVSGDWQNVELVINHNTCLTGGERQDESGEKKIISFLHAFFFLTGQDMHLRLGLKEVNKIKIMWIFFYLLGVWVTYNTHLKTQHVFNKEALKAPCGCP